MMKYCDLYCEFAEFPEKLADGSLSCRTFIGIYCRQLKRIVPKNGPCQLALKDNQPEEQSNPK